MGRQDIVVTQSVSELRKKRKRKRRRRSFIATSVVLAFAIIGIISVIISFIKISGDIFYETEQKEEYEEYVLPVVMSNLPPFTDITTVQMSELQYTSLWSVVVNNGLEQYPIDPETGDMLVPASDLDIQAKYLFGNKIALEHGTFTIDNIMVYIYDEEMKTYHININVTTQMYTPSVSDIQQNKIKADLSELEKSNLIKDSKLDEVFPIGLTVGYIPPGTLWEMNLKGEKVQADPDVYRKIYIDFNEDGSKFIAAIKDIPKETYGTSSNSSEDQNYSDSYDSTSNSNENINSDSNQENVSDNQITESEQNVSEENTSSVDESSKDSSSETSTTSDDAGKKTSS